MHDQVAHLRVYEELNDFLPPGKRNVLFPYRFSGTPAVKDAIEAEGIPHTEVDLILVNGASVPFAYRLQDGDCVAVYPGCERLDITPIVRLRPRPLRVTTFILDVHLGKLARFLRMLGFDTLYRNDYDDPDIIAIALQDRRIILTRDRGILKHRVVTHGYWIRSLTPTQQVREVLTRFNLVAQVRPFQRCMRCNGIVVRVDKRAILSRLQPKTARYYDDFYQCAACANIYWPGSHHQHMQQLIQEWVTQPHG